MLPRWRRGISALMAAALCPFSFCAAALPFSHEVSKQAAGGGGGGGRVAVESAYGRTASAWLHLTTLGLGGSCPSAVVYLEFRPTSQRNECYVDPRVSIGTTTLVGSFALLGVFQWHIFVSRRFGCGI